MKKIFVLFLTAVVVCAAFVGCSKSGGDEGEGNTVSTTKPIVTEDAKIKESDALDFIKNAYTTEELGLDKTDKNYQFMIASNGVEIDGKNYVKVVANVPVQNDTTSADGKVTYSMETLGEYYISFDGKTVLIKDMKTNEYSELENKYEEYKEKGETTAPATSESKETESKKDK